jgi:P4 family phage/plasmid primase-like protien
MSMYKGGNAPVAALTATEKLKSNALTQDIQQDNYSPEMLKSELPGKCPEAAHWWHEFGFTVIPICPNEKHHACQWQPWLDKLNHDPISKHWGAKPNHELGAVLDHSLIVFDADSKESLDALYILEKEFDKTPNLVVKTKKGEHHFFKRATGTYAITKGYSTKKDAKKIDVKTGRSETDGRSIVVLAPSTNKTIEMNEADSAADLVEVDQAFIDAVFEHNGEKPPRLPEPKVIQEYSDQAGKHEVAEILSYIKADLDYSDWLTVLMGVHAHFNGAEIGLHIVDAWSATASNYAGAEVIEYKWRSFFLDGGVTFASVCDMAKKSGADLGAIKKKYDENGDPNPTYEEMLDQAQQLTPESESDINALLKYCRSLSVIQSRRLLNTIKKSTGIPLGTLKDAIKEVSPENDEPDQLAMAMAVVNNIGRENIISTQAFVWAWEDTGVWRKQEERSIKQFVQKIVPPMVDNVTKNIVDGVTDLFKTEVFSPDHKFDVGKPESVNCLNGQLTLFNETGGWLLARHIREDYRTTQIPIEYDNDARSPRFIQFMAEVFGGDIDADDKTKALLEMVGYPLMAHCRHERFIILVGSGANGKSVLLYIIEALCGFNNVACVQPSQFDNKFQRAYLHGKLANIVTEIEQGATIADGALKSIVSGEGNTAENKFGHPFTFHPFSTCWFGTNHLPHTRDFSDAVFRRTLIVSFNNAFKPELGNCDPMLKDKLIDELPGILNMALDAYATALKDGFTMPASSVTAAQEWRLEADQVSQFVNDQGTKNPSARIPISLAFNQYKDWAQDNGINKSVAMKSFRDRLTKLGYGFERDSKTRYVTGLALDTAQPFHSNGYQKASNGY